MKKKNIQAFKKDGILKMVQVISVLHIIFFVTSCGGGGGSNATTVVPPPQYGTIEGYVYAPIGSGARVAEAAPSGKKAVQGATISASCGSTDKNSTTNSSGYFKITSLPTGTCSLDVTYSGFDKYHTNISVSANSTTIVGGNSGISISPTTSGSISVTTNVSGGTVFIDGESTGLTIPTSLSYSIDSIAPGDHTITISQAGYDDVDVQVINIKAGQTEAITFSLNPTGNRVPVSDAGNNFKSFSGTKYEYEGWSGSEYIFTPTPIAVTLDGTNSSDPDGDILSYQWEQVSGPAVSLVNPTAATSSFTPTQEGTYEFSLKISDGYLESASDTVVVSITKPAGKLVFSCAYKSTATSELCSMNADGSSLFHLTENNIDDSYAQWSPDGTKVSYSADDGTDTFMALINSDGTGQTTTSIEYGVSDWFSDNEILTYKYYSGYLDFYKINIDGTNEQRLTFTDERGIFAQLSPDGSKIAYAKNYGGDNYEIVVMDSDGSNITRLTNNATTETYFTWLDDNRIIYETHNFIGDKTRGVFVMNADGTNVTEIPMPFGVTDIKSNITANSDGQLVFFKDQNSYLHIMYADGSASISYGIGASNPDYHPGP